MSYTLFHICSDIDIIDEKRGKVYFVKVMIII